MVNNCLMPLRQLSYCIAYNTPMMTLYPRRLNAGRRTRPSHAELPRVHGRERSYAESQPRVPALLCSAVREIPEYTLQLRPLVSGTSGPPHFHHPRYHVIKTCYRVFAIYIRQALYTMCVEWKLLRWFL